MLISIGGRKFVFAILLVCLFGMFVLASKISVDQFMSGALLAMSIFTAGNVGEKFASVK